MTRAIDSSAFKGISIAIEHGEKPQLEWIAIASLRIDDRYQREIRGEGRRNVKKIAGNFRWTSFAPVIVSPIKGGLYAIVDGQHRVTAAAVVGIESVPCQVIVASPAQQAAAFRDINGATTKMTPLMIHAAAIAARDPDALAIADVCARAEVEVLRYPVQASQQKPAQTMAVGSIADCLRTFGRDVLVTALQCVTQTENNVPGALQASVIRALCLLLFNKPSWCELGGKLLEAFDAIDVCAERDNAQEQSKPKGMTTSAALTARLCKLVAEELGEPA